jgi:hypothetical protein
MVLEFYLGKGSWDCDYQTSLELGHEFGPAPDQEGCVIPVALTLRWLREQIDRDYSVASRGRLLGMSERQIESELRRARFKLELLSEARFSKIPDEAYSDEVLGMLRRLRTQLRERNIRRYSPPASAQSEELSTVPPGLTGWALSKAQDAQRAVAENKSQHSILE